MKKLGLLGYPLKHSYSAKLYNALFKKHGVDAEYINLEIEPAEIENTIKAILSNESWIGFNITKPYKEKVARYLSSLTKSAQEIGAINIALRENHLGDNTDWKGFYKSLQDFPDIKSATVIGAGGAGKAVAYALLRKGIKRLFILNRTISKAQRLKEKLSHLFKDAEIEIKALDESGVAISESDIVVNATPVGMYPKVEETLPIDFKAFTSSKIAYDLIYNPEETSFLKEARLRGAKTISGIEMFLNQAAENLQLWGFEELSHEVRAVDILRELA
ncbi:MAG: shikimate dehydrogenase [Synergistetes bacterium]|nr:shikimate dehydrogenase [Synergistota bacterium]